VPSSSAPLDGSHLGEADLILALISGIVITLRLWHAARTALELNEYDAGAAPVANVLLGLFGDGDLARHNDVLAPPRELAAAVGGRSRWRTAAGAPSAGASGAHMWMEEHAMPINEERVREASATGADTLAVACPFCTVMLDDGVKSAGGDLRVADVATLLAEAVERRTGAGS
jgi:hypothetical protein